MAQRSQEQPSIIPYRSNPWLVLKKKFMDAFSDYAKCERAQDELKRLKMKNNNLDGYVAAFETLALHAELDVNDPSNL